MPVSALLESYYGKGTGAAQPTKSQGSHRFDAFVRKATPPIPYHSANKDGSGPIMLDAEASDAIYDALYGTARLFVAHDASYGFGQETLDYYGPLLRYVAERFTQFLTTGLATGDAPWPGVQMTGSSGSGEES